MKNKIVKNHKIIVGIIIGLIISAGAVYAATVTADSSNVSYDNTKSGLKSTTLKGAIDELYTEVKTHCPSGYICNKGCRVLGNSGKTIGAEVTCGGENFYIASTGSIITLIAKYGLDSSYQQSPNPTPVNYSNATEYIENYVKTALSGININGQINYYGHPSEEELIKLATGTTSNSGSTYYLGEKLDIDNTEKKCGQKRKGYWVDSSHTYAWQCGPNAYATWSMTDNSVTSKTVESGAVISFHARPMIKVIASVIS